MSQKLNENTPKNIKNKDHSSSWANIFMTVRLFSQSTGEWNEPCYHKPFGLLLPANEPLANQGECARGLLSLMLSVIWLPVV